MSGYVASLDFVAPSPARRRYAEFNGLRALAAMSVVAIHTWTPDSIFVSWRVKLFFVLSGFLIGGILLRGRGLVASGRTTLSHFLRSFYARRAIRLLPPLFVTILVTWLAAYWTQGSVLWHLLQATNIYLAVQNHWAAGPLNHLWSLNVEEQLCLVFPLLVLLLPDRALLPGILLAIVAEPAFLVASSLVGPSANLWIVLVPASLGSFGMGILGAYLAARDRRIVTFDHLGLLMALVCVVSETLRVASGPGVMSAWYAVVSGSALNIALAAVVVRAAAGSPGPVHALLCSGPMQHLGRLSYGVYLFHLPLLAILTRVLLHFRLPMPGFGPGLFVITLALAIAAAQLWETLAGRRLAGLRQRFPYEAPGSKAAGTDALD